MAEVTIRPATPAPSVQANSRDTRVVGVHPQQAHVTNGAAVKIAGGPSANITANMGPSGARVRGPGQGGNEAKKPIASTNANARPIPGPPRAAAAAEPLPAETASAPMLSMSEAALALEIVEGQVAQAVVTKAGPEALLALAKELVVKLRAIAGVPASVPLPWDLMKPAEAAPPSASIGTPANAASAASVPMERPSKNEGIPDPVPVPVPDSAK